MRVLRTRFMVRWVAAAALIVASPRPQPRAEQPIEGIAAREIEFQGLKDEAPIAFRDMGAFAALLKRAREARPADLAERARRDVGFRELWDHPEDYRGVLLELRGFCRHIDSSGSKLGAGGRLHEVWITLPEGELTPFVCIAEKLPEGFAINATNSEPVVFLGFFLKVMAYDSGEGRRGAPLLIGRLERVAGEKNADPLDEEQARRIPVGAGPALAMPRQEDRFTISVDRNGALALEEKPIARKDLAAKLGRLAAQVRLNARAIGTPLDAIRELPAVIVIHPDDETTCSTILPLMDDCRRSGFVQFALKSPKIQFDADRLVAANAVPAARNHENDLPVGLRTIPIQLRADDRGQIARAQVGELQHRDFDTLRAELTSILNDPELPFDRARITVDPRLFCSELGRVIEVLTRLNVQMIELSLLEPD